MSVVVVSVVVVLVLLESVAPLFEHALIKPSATIITTFCVSGFIRSSIMALPYHPLKEQFLGQKIGMRKSILEIIVCEQTRVVLLFAHRNLRFEAAFP